MKNNKIFLILKLIEISVVIAELVLLFIPNAILIKTVNSTNETIYTSSSFFNGLVFSKATLLSIIIFVIMANIIFIVLGFILKKKWFTMVELVLELLIVVLIRLHTYFVGNDVFTPILITLMGLGLLGASVSFFIYKITYANEDLEVREVK